MIPSQQSRLTIVRDVWDLKAFAAVGLVGLELDPQSPGARGEGNGPLVRLTGLVGGDGGRQGYKHDRNKH